MTDDRNSNRRSSVGAPLRRTSAAPQATTAVNCEACGHANPASAAFCEECGQSLAAPARCGRCQSATHPGADICEACGTWLLEGQCMFCYAPVGEDESFCAQCGNPAQGIACTRCGQVSIFDFCKTCGQALTEQAAQSVEQAAHGADTQGVVALVTSLTALLPDPALDDPASQAAVAAPRLLDAGLREAAERLRRYRESVRDEPAPAPAVKAPSPLFTGTQKARIGELNDAIAEETRRREEEAERQRLEAERQRLEAQRRHEQALLRQRELRDDLLRELRKFAGKTFWNHQEARRFSMALLSTLPAELLAELKRSGLGWRCNAYDCVHNAPADCADPSKGGVWLLR